MRVRESFAREVKTLRSFVRDIPPRLITKTAQAMGAVRAAELDRFLDALNAETFYGRRCSAEPSLLIIR